VIVFIQFYDFFFAVEYLTCISSDSPKVFRRLLSIWLASLHVFRRIFKHFS